MSALQDIPYMNRYVKEVRETRDWFAAELGKYEDIRVFSGAGNFVMIRFKTVEEKDCFISFMESQDIFVRNLQQDGSVVLCVRVTIGTRAQMETVLQKIENWFKR